MFGNRKNTHKRNLSRQFDKIRANNLHQIEKLEGRVMLDAATLLEFAALIAPTISSTEFTANPDQSYGMNDQDVASMIPSVELPAISLDAATPTPMLQHALGIAMVDASRSLAESNHTELEFSFNIYQLTDGPANESQIVAATDAGPLAFAPEVEPGSDTTTAAERDEELQEFFIWFNAQNEANGEPPAMPMIDPTFELPHAHPLETEDPTDMRAPLSERNTSPAVDDFTYGLHNPESASDDQFTERTYHEDHATDSHNSDTAIHVRSIELADRSFELTTHDTASENIHTVENTSQSTQPGTESIHHASMPTDLSHSLALIRTLEHFVVAQRELLETFEGYGADLQGLRNTLKGLQNDAHAIRLESIQDSIDTLNELAKYFADIGFPGNEQLLRQQVETLTSVRNHLLAVSQRVKWQPEEAARVFNHSLESLLDEQFQQVTGDRQDGHFLEPSWRLFGDCTLLSDTTVKGLLLVRFVYAEQLDLVADQLEAQRNLPREERLDLARELHRAARQVQDANLSTTTAYWAATTPSGANSRLTSRDRYESSMQQVQRAEERGDVAEAQQLRADARSEGWALYLRRRQEYFDLLDRYPSLGLDGDDGLLFRALAFADDDQILDLVDRYLDLGIEHLREEAETVRADSSIEALWEFVDGRFARVHESASSLGAEFGSDRAAMYVDEAVSVHDAVEYVDEYVESAWDSGLSILAAGISLVPVYGPFLGAGVTLIEIGRDGGEVIVCYAQELDAYDTALVTGYEHIMVAEDRSANAADQLKETFIYGILEIPGLGAARQTQRGTSVDDVVDAAGSTPRVTDGRFPGEAAPNGLPAGREDIASSRAHSSEPALSDTHIESDSPRSNAPASGDSRCTDDTAVPYGFRDEPTELDHVPGLDPEIDPHCHVVGTYDPLPPRDSSPPAADAPPPVLDSSDPRLARTVIDSPPQVQNGPVRSAGDDFDPDAPTHVNNGLNDPLAQQTGIYPALSDDVAEGANRAGPETASAPEYVPSDPRLARTVVESPQGPRGVTPDGRTYDKLVDDVRSDPFVAGPTGDCEQAAEIIKESLGEGALRLPLAAEGRAGNIFHWYVKYGNTVFDPTAAQFIRPDMLSPEQVASAGLTEAIQRGIFTESQYGLFASMVIAAAQ